MTHRYVCKACAFEVQSPNDAELVDIVREHANDRHRMNISRAEVKEGWEPVGTADDN